MDYLVTFDDGFEALMHHGTKGMHWGTWNAETKQKYKANPDLLPKMAAVAGGIAEKIAESARDMAGASGGNNESKAAANGNVDEIATNVIRGDYGNGEERRQKLTEAGYDYDTVQSRVNDIIYGRATPAEAKSDGGEKSSSDTDAVASTVIRGDYGNGEERRQRLSKAGYDYDKVQSRVNEIIYGRSKK